MHFGTLDLCLAYIGIGLPGDLMLFYDYDATLKTLRNTRKRKTTPLLALTLCLMALCYGIHVDIAWKYYFHQILSLLGNIHGILRLKESFQTMLQYFCCNSQSRWARLWVWLADLCILVCICISSQNLYYQEWKDGALLIKYDEYLRIFFHIFRVTLLIAVIACIFENGLTASALIHEYNTRDTTELRGSVNQAFVYTIEVLKSRVWEENFSDVYFLFAHLI